MCYCLLRYYLETKERYTHFDISDFEKYGSFITHTDFDEWTNSWSTHPTYKENKLLQKCAQKIQIKDIEACSHKKQSWVSFSIMKKVEIEDNKERTSGSKEKAYLYFDEDPSSSKKQKNTDDNEE